MSSNMENNDNEYDVSLDAMLLAGAQLYPAVLNAAIELNLFKIIGEGSPKGMSPSEIASHLPNAHADTVRRLDRLLFLLATHSVFWLVFLPISFMMVAPRGFMLYPLPGDTCSPMKIEPLMLQSPN